MASLQEHKQKWLHNREFLRTVGDEYPGWMATVMFYTALHAVETLFRTDNLHPHTSHPARNETLKTVNRYKKVWQNYRPLYDASRSARYDADASGWLTKTDVQTKLVRHLYALEQSVQKLIGDTEVLNRIWE